MTIAIALSCKDGIVVAVDSLATFSRGAPVTRFTNKVFKIEDPSLLHPVVVAGAGMMAFIDKFLDRVKREGIKTASEDGKRKLDITDFVERVCETVVTIMAKEYAIDRNKFFGTFMSDYSLSLVVAGMTAGDAQNPGQLRAYHVHPNGLAEPIERYGTTGSGAAYAELFLHGFVPANDDFSLKDAVRLVGYTIKGVEIMDPNVGGDTKGYTLKNDNGSLSVERLDSSALPTQAREKMESVLTKLGDDMRAIVDKPARAKKTKASRKR